MSTPTVAATEHALKRIEQVRANRRQPDAGVRIAITGRKDGAFVYDLQLVPAGEERDGDVHWEGPNGIVFHAPEASAAYLEGATVDADRLSGALTVRNPNPLWLDPLAEQVQQYLDEAINPMVAQHGGVIDLLDLTDGVAYINMGGACQGCGMASVTLGEGVRTALHDRFPEIRKILDQTDHAAGANPYYQASKK